MKESNKTAAKREYISPDCKLFTVRNASVICTSDEQTENVDETYGQW